MSAFDCIEEIRRAGGGKLSDEAIDSLVEDVQRRAARRAGGVESHADALLAAAREIGDEAKTAAIIERRNRAINIARRKELETRIARWTDPAEALAAINVGLNRPVEGGRLSVDTRQKALKGKFQGSLLHDLRREGLLEFVTRTSGGTWERLTGAGPGPLDREIAMELWEIGRDGGRPGISGSDEARRIAAIIHKHQEAARILQNRAGAWIRKMPGYIVGQSHDMTRLRAAGFAEWAAFIGPRLDADKTFGDAAPAEFLKGVFEGLASGEHYRAKGAGDDWLGGFKGPANLAKRASAERVLHFKSAQDWYEYNMRFGSASLMEAVMHGLNRAADNVGLMEVWGTNPRAMFDAVMADLVQKNRADFKVTDRLRAQILDAQFAEVDGTSRVPGNVTWARWSSAARAIQSMSKLGGAVVSSLSDMTVMPFELKRQGVGLLDGYKLAFEDLVHGRGEGERREVADLVGVGIETMVGDVMSRFSSTDHLPGTMAKLMQRFFKLNLLSWWVDSHKTGVGFMLARELGMKAGAGWSTLPEETRRMLALYEVGEREWDAIRATAWDGEDGRKFITPERVQDLPDDVVDGLIDGGPAAMVEAYRARVDALVEKYRQAETRMGDLDRLMGKVEQAEIRATLDAHRRQLRATQALRDQLVAYRDGTRPFGKVHAELRREIEHLSKAQRRIGEEAGARIERMTARLRKLAGSDGDWSARLESLRSDLSAIADELAALPDRLERDISSARARARDRLETKLRGYFIDRIDHAVLTPGARENAIMRQGTRPGTALGEAARFFFQFKAFPITFITKALGPAVYGRGARTLREALLRGKGDMQGLAHLMVGTTVLGYLAMSAKDMLKGRTPRDPQDPETWLAAFQQGGGAGIYADFLFGEFNRFGGGAIATFGGPTVTSAEDLFRLYARVRDGDDVAAQAFRTALNHTPFINLFYTRIALDYLILHDVAEALNPGSLRRLERRIERENAQRFMLKPSRDRLRPITG